MIGQIIFSLIVQQRENILKAGSHSRIPPQGAILVKKKIPWFIHWSEKQNINLAVQKKIGQRKAELVCKGNENVLVLHSSWRRRG